MLKLYNKIVKPYNLIAEFGSPGEGRNPCYTSATKTFYS
jgi:hypothetical protein